MQRTTLTIFYFFSGDMFPGKMYSCDYCGRLCTNKTSYKRHVVTHTGEKEFKCEICGKSFNRKWNLKAHMMLHLQKDAWVDYMDNLVWVDYNLVWVDYRQVGLSWQYRQFHLSWLYGQFHLSWLYRQFGLSWLQTS